MGLAKRFAAKVSAFVGKRWGDEAHCFALEEEGRRLIALHLPGQRFRFELSTRSSFIHTAHLTLEPHGGAEEDVSFGLGLGRLSAHFAIGRTPKVLRDWWTKRYRWAAREFWLYSSHSDDVVGEELRTVWRFWCDPMEHKSSTPRWRDGSFSWLDAIFGETKMDNREGPVRKVGIPMPEGIYPAVAKVTKRHAWRPRDLLGWFRSSGTSVSIDVPLGIPHQGKGENSWDCDEDALYGLSTPARSVGEAIGATVGCVMRDRERYDGNLDAVYPDVATRAVRIGEARAKAMNTEGAVR